MKEELGELTGYFPTLVLERWVIMPNHLHMLLTLTAAGASPRPTSAASDHPTLADIMQVFKPRTTRRWNRAVAVSGRPLWQAPYHDHIIRDEHDFQLHWDYIDNNPARWAEDEYYINCEG